MVQHHLEPSRRAGNVRLEVVTLGDDLPDFVQNEHALLLRGRGLDEALGYRFEDANHPNFAGLRHLYQGNHGSGIRSVVLRVEAINYVLQDHAVATVVPVVLEGGCEDTLGSFPPHALEDPLHRRTLQVKEFLQGHSHAIEAASKLLRLVLLESVEIVVDHRCSVARLVPTYHPSAPGKVALSEDRDEGVPDAPDHGRQPTEDLGVLVRAQKPVALEQAHLHVDARKELADARYFVEPVPAGLLGVDIYVFRGPVGRQAALLLLLLLLPFLALLLFLLLLFLFLAFLLLLRLAQYPIPNDLSKRVQNLCHHDEDARVKLRHGRVGQQPRALDDDFDG
mmetsp:Transcript_11372/g.20661  ORF Transcript_11372/g.20661 Transcript_11372/m.20661 type:complete len:337 (-) Transcript_11372:62-1072(-)